MAAKKTRGASRALPLHSLVWNLSKAETRMWHDPDPRTRNPIQDKYKGQVARAIKAGVGHCFVLDADGKLVYSRP